MEKSFAIIRNNVILIMIQGAKDYTLNEKDLLNLNIMR